MSITRFNSEYVFLSNFYPSPIIMDGIKYPTVEHAYQAAKTLDQHEKLAIAAALSPGQAKKMGRKISLRCDWKEVKILIMLELLHLKFADSVLKDQLLATGDAELIESNDWGDKFWGMCCGKGSNNLGKLLMLVRRHHAVSNDVGSSP